MYYNNIECEVISQINTNESVIEIDTGSIAYRDEFGEYEEPISRKLIVDNKYLTFEKITQSSIIADRKKMISDVEKHNAKKYTEANQLIRDERYKIEAEIKELKNKMSKFDGMLEFYKFINNDYKYFLSKKGFGGLKILSKEELVVYKDGRDIKEKAVGFESVLISDKETKRYTGNFRITMTVHRYSDGSGDANYIQGFETLEEAIVAYKDLLKTTIIVGLYDVKTCNKYNIINEKVIAYETKNKAVQKENNEKEIARCQAKIKDLEDKL